MRLKAMLALLRTSHGVRSGVVLGIATLVLNGGGYLFNLACIRYLGSAGYGDVAALMALTALIALPLGSLQTLLAREVADLDSRDARGQINRLLRRSLLISIPLSLALLALGLALVGPLEDALKIGSSITVVAGLSGVVFAIMAVVLYGFLQGKQRFWSLSTTYAASGLARPVLVVPALLLGLGAAGALAVNTLAGFIAVALAAFALRDVWLGEISEEAPALERGQVAVLLAGSLAFASLTNVDVLLASYYLSDEAAGVYAAAAFVGKFVLFLPSAIVIVLLPKATERAAVGVAPHRILLASAGVTAFLSLSASLLLALVPEDLVVRTFGGDFRNATGLLGWFGLAMTAAALLNIHLSVYFAQRDFRFPLLVVAATVAQIFGIALWHSEPRSIVIVTMSCCVAALAIHELAFPNRLTRIWRATGPPSSTPLAPH